MPVAAAAPPAPPAPPKIELPSSSADYLQNPKPVYPPLSKRLGEQGKVMVRVLIAADGTVQSATLAQSSGFTRLDESAMAAVLKWRFVPGKRNGIAEAMWHQIPVNFVLE
jgi:protein TonB